jgi:hypothetical protein
MTIPALLFMDKWPRRRVMMAGSFLMAMWLFTEGAIMAVYGHAVPGGVDGVTTVTWVSSIEYNLYCETKDVSVIAL